MTTRIHKLNFVVVAAAALTVATSAFAGTIVIKPVGVSGTASLGNTDGDIDWLIDDNPAEDADSNAGTPVDHMQRPAGTVGALLNTGVSKADGEATLQSLSSAGEKESYIPRIEDNPIVIFDLGQDYSVDELLFWPYANFNGGAGDDNRVGDVKLHLQTDAEGNDFSLVNWATPDAGAFTTTNNQTGNAGWPNTETPDIFTFNAQTARYVAMQFATKANGNSTGNAAAGEVRFIGDVLGGGGANGTPEPSTAVLAVLGLIGVAGFGRRRRRNRA